MSRGDVVWIDLGQAPAGTRACVIVSNDAANRGSKSVTVVPISTDVTTIRPFEVPLREAVLGRAAKAQAHQVRAAEAWRLRGFPAGALDPKTMARLDEALRLHLGV